MRLLIYDSGDFSSGAAAELNALVRSRGWHSQRVSGVTDLSRQLLLPIGGKARSFRESILCYERAAHSRYWRKLGRQTFEAFIGFGSLSAPLAAALPVAWPKIAIVHCFESERLANGLNGSAARLAYDLRIEMDLLRVFTRILASNELAPQLSECGMSPCLFDGIAAIEKILASRRAA